MTIENKSFDYIVVGCGFWGTTFANKIATELNKKVLIIDSRNHIGGTCYSEIDEKTNIEFHKYGSHIFHTSHEDVWNFLNQFDKFNNYKHQIVTKYNEKYYTFPINLLTINNFFDLNLSPFEAEEFIQKEIQKCELKNPKNLEEKAISLVGKTLYESFIKGYTEKQWKRSAKDLPASIIDRLHLRKNFRTSYFEDTYEGIPINGWTNLFKKILSNKNITIKLNTNYFDIKNEINDNTKIIYTGSIDKFFDYKYGKLEWIGLDFEFKTYKYKDWQGISILNYSNKEIKQTRTHEFKHLHPEREEVFNKNETLICYEYPKKASDNDEKFYPIPTEANINIYNKYKKEALKNPNLILGGRLGLYKYMNMDTTIKNALDTFNSLKEKGLL